MRRRIAQSILLTTLLVGSLTAAEDKNSNTPWTLQDLLRYTVENSPLILKARQEKQQTQLQETQIKSLFWPKLRLETSHGFRNQDPSPYKASESSSAALGLSENVWNKGIDSKKLEIARLAKRQAEIQYFQKRDETCLHVTQEYYRYSQLAKALQIQKNQQKLLKKQFDLVADEYLHGLRSRRDFLRFKSQSQRAELDLQKQFTVIETSRLNLMALAGFREVDKDQQFQPEYSQPPLLDLFKNQAELNNTYEDQLLTLNQQSSDLNQELSLKSFGPEVTADLSARLGSGGYWNTGNTWSDHQATSWGAMLNFNWTLWDKDSQESRKALVVLQTEMQKTDLLQKKILLQTEIQKLQRTFLQLKENYKTSEELLILEQNNFLFLEGEYRQSKASYLDFINGVKDLSEAENRHWTNMFDLKQGIILYHYYRGSLYRYLLSDYTNNSDLQNEEP